MKLFSLTDQNPEILDELIEEMNLLYESSEKTLMALEASPDDTELKNDIFRSVHTIKGNLGFVHFEPMITLLQHTEDLLHLLRSKEVHYSAVMSDLVLLTMDRVIFFVNDCIQNNETEYDDLMLERLVSKIQRITSNNAEHHERILIEAVLLLDPSLSSNVNYQIDSAVSNQEASERALDYIGIGTLAQEQEQDIIFFRQMIVPVEKRSKFWLGRSDRIAKLCLFLNKAAGSPVDEKQLAIACYVYDFGMAFMPLNLLHKTGKLSPAEFQLMQSHVYKSAQILEHFDIWTDAREIVLQHHERNDGSGYPLKLTSTDICDGAKLLAIVDTFDALTHHRAHQTHIKRPKKYAVIELNNIAPKLFSKKWMAVFNRTMDTLLNKKK